MKRIILFFALLFITLLATAQQELAKTNDDINAVFGKGGKANSVGLKFGEF